MPTMCRARLPGQGAVGFSFRPRCGAAAAAGPALWSTGGSPGNHSYPSVRLLLKWRRSRRGCACAPSHSTALAVMVNTQA